MNSEVKICLATQYRLLSSERNAYTKLGGKRDAHGGAGAEEVAERSAGNAELIGGDDRICCRASRICANVLNVPRLGLRRWNRQRGNICDVVGSGVIALDQ